MKLTTLSMTTLAAVLMMPTAASAQMFGGPNFNSNTLIGAVAGGALGSNLAGSGVQQEGTAIGAVLGGLAANAYTNRGSSRYGGGYPAYGRANNSGLMGAGIGALAGGVLGSNLAGSGVQQEGTAIGAVVGGLIGYGLTNRSNSYNSYNGGSSRYGYTPPSYGTFGGNIIAPAPMPAPMSWPTPQYIPSQEFVSQTYTMPSTTRHVYHPAAPVAPVTRISHVYHAAPTPAPIINRVVHHQAAPQAPQIINKVVHHQAPAVQPEVKTVHVYEQAPATYTAPQTTTQHVYEQAPTQSYTSSGSYTNSTQGLRVAPFITTLPRPTRSSGVYCYAGSSKRYDANGNEVTGSLTCG